MPFNGTGTFNRVHNWTSDAANNLDINAGEMDAEDNGFAAGLSLCVTRDGQGKMAADFLPGASGVYNLGTAIAQWLTLNGVPAPTSGQNIGLLLFPQTAAESSALITPTSNAYPSAPYGENVFRYFTAAQIADCLSYTASLDVTAAIQTGINALEQLNSGILFFPPGKYKISSTLTVTKPVILRGSGCGEISASSATTPATWLFWAGGASDMLHYGGFGTNFTGGGIYDLTLDGQSTATNGLVTKDCNRTTIHRVCIANTVTNGWLLTNTLTLFPSGFYDVEDLRITQATSGATLAANGIAIQGVTTPGTDGVTLCTLRRVRIDHGNGAGVLIGQGLGGTPDAGDRFTWYDLFTFRPNANTGFGVSFAQVNTSSICTQHIFIGQEVTGGFNFATPGMNYGTQMIAGTELDLNSNVTKLLSGPGAIDIDCQTQSGARFGRGFFTPGYHTSLINDAFNFTRYDSVNQILQTGNGNWNVTNASGGTITDAGTPGGGVNLTTAATNNTFIAIIQPQNVASGINAAASPIYAINFVIESSTFNRIRMGFFDVTGAGAVNNGVYVQYDPSVNAAFQLITALAGVQTVVTLGFGPNIGLIFEWTIRFDSAGAQFNYRAGGFTGVANGGVITTNIPTTTLFYGVSLVATSNAARTLIINAIKMGFLDENYPQT